MDQPQPNFVSKQSPSYSPSLSSSSSVISCHNLNNLPSFESSMQSCSKPSALFDPETGAELHRHPEFFFSDGSVVCKAENTLFRVHMSQLSRHSLCFRDMFSIGKHTDSVLGASIHSKDGTNDFENCPLIQLHDTAEDVGNLFAALYDGPHFGNNDQEDFRVVSGVLRLSTKYLIDSLREKAITHLSKAWPSTLRGWDAREELARAYEIETGTSGARLYPSPIAVINLAREVDCPSLLPSAFFDLSRYTFSQIFDPCVEDPLYYPIASSPSLPSPSPSPSLPPPSITLSLGDTQRLCIGKEASHHAITSLIQSISNSQSIRNSGLQLQSAFSLSHPLSHSHPPSLSGSMHQSGHYNHHRRSSSTAICISAAACRKDFSELVDLATKHYLFDRERGYSDPLYTADEIGGLKSEASECKACAKSLETWAMRERERIWRIIPIWFRLGSDSPNSERTGSPPVPVVDMEV
ncbi:hypothetical protein GYMLUDRAFT_43809 [Collybiopsis luxurians FD-317 M1]|uniref:BTB domain-containing protein n=1 Tax=Collybiopsis luxurians FD-317 M1 TaxID=944289 RepID=A0A0D0BXR7_9AGAR|nr:hypothetical protein GYMLUDRAFT_43809 [Collybiopsis luxurians FD-317 M1]